MNNITVGEIIGRCDPDTVVKVMIGRSVDDALAGSGGILFNIDRHTVASDHRLLSDALVITVDDSTGEDDPNIRRYRDKGMTYAQARVMHLRNLGYEQSEIADMENTTRAAIQKREDLAKKKIGRTMFYERR